MEDAVIATDKDLRVTAWNRGAERIYGWQAHEVLGQPVQTVVNSSLAPEQRNSLIQEVGQSGIPSMEVMYHHHKDGTPLQLEANTIVLRSADQQVTGYLSINRDIHERKQAEQQINFQAGLLDVVEQAVIAVDLTGHIIDRNRFAEQLYGWRSDEVAGRNAVEVIPNTTTAEQAAAMATQFQNGKSWSGEFMVQHRNGTAFPAQVLNSPIYAENGALLGFVGVSVDVTARKQPRPPCVASPICWNKRMMRSLCGRWTAQSPIGIKAPSNSMVTPKRKRSARSAILCCRRCILINRSF